MRSLVAVLAVALALGCSPGNDDGGGGGGGGGNGGGNNNPPGNNPAPLMVVTTVPDDGDLDRAIDVDVVITFNQNIDAATVNANTITFTSNLGPVDGAFTVQGMVVTFNPMDDLPNASPIVGTVTTDVQSTTGAQLAQDYQFAFGTVGATTVIADGEGLEQPCVAVSAGGLVMTMWVQNDAGTWRLFAREWEALTGWAMTTEFVVSGNTITGLALRCTENNEAVAVWAEGGTSYFTARFTAGQGWDATDTLSTAGTAGQIGFTMHREGWGAATYRVGNTSTLRYLDANGTWGAEEAPGYGFYAEAGANGQLFGAFSVYNPATGSGQYIAARYVPGEGWTTDSLGSGAAFPIYGGIGMANGGGAYLAGGGDLAFWQFDGMEWSDAVYIDGPPGQTQSIDLASAPTGEACTAWVVQTNIGTRNLTGAFLDANGNWIDVEALDLGDFFPGTPQVACTDAGQGWVVFTQYDGTAESIWFARYVPGIGWIMAMEIDEDDFNSSEPRLAAQGPGGCAIWFRMNNGTTELVARLLN